MKEVYVEAATAYTQKLNMMLNLKKSDELSYDVFQNMQTKQDTEMDEIEKEVYEERGYNEIFVQEWLERFKDDAEIKALFDKLKSLNETVFDFDNPRMEHIKCENMPEGLNEETYLQIFRKQQAAIRHHIYKTLKQTGGVT